MSVLVETPFKLTLEETLCSAAATLCLLELAKIRTPTLTIAEMCLTPQYGFTASASLEQLGPRFVRITDIKGGAIDWNTVPFCDCPNPGSYELRAGDILIARSGSIGKSFIVTNVPETAVFASYMIRLRTKPDFAPLYVYWCIQSQQFWQQITEAQRGSAMNNINGKMLASLRFPAPSRDIQDAIAIFLNSFRKRLSGKETVQSQTLLPSFLHEQRRIVARIEELAARIEEARGLRREAVEEAEVLVYSSARRLLATVKSELTEVRCWLDENRNGIQTGPFGAQLSKQDFEITGVPILSIGNIQYSGLELNDLKYVSEEKAQQLSRFSIRAGDILFARMGTVGRCCVVPQKAEGWLFNYHIIRVALDRSRVDPRYIHWSLRASKDVEHYLDEKIRGATREGVNSSIVGSLPIRVSSLTEQRHIVAFLDDLQAKVDDLRQRQSETSAELDALLPSILDKAFKGEL